MAEAGSYGTARSGNWLWALLVGATLLLMEFILLAALVPTSWSERVRGTELAWLQDRLGPRTTDAVVERAEHWYSALFVEPGLVETSYRITLPSDVDVLELEPRQVFDDRIIPGDESLVDHGSNRRRRKSLGYGTDLEECFGIHPLRATQFLHAETAAEDELVPVDDGHGQSR